MAVLFRKGLAITFHGDGKDKNGRVVWSLVEIDTKMLLIICVYAPSQGDNPNFFKDDVFPILDNVDYDHIVIVDDWNLGMDESLDYYGYAFFLLDRWVWGPIHCLAHKKISIYSRDETTDK